MMTAIETTSAADFDLHRISVKLFADASPRPPTDKIIEVLHGFIQQQKLDEILIDVTDYSHTKPGPGVLLLAHAANYGLGDADGRYGLLYARKRDATGTLEARFSDALRRTLAAAALLETALDTLRFASDELRIVLNDRLAAPNEEATLDAVRPALLAALRAVFPDASATVARVGEPRDPLTIAVKLAR